MVGLLLAIVLPLMRQRGTRSWARVHGEDGPIYTVEAMRHGTLDVLLRGYAGYLQLPSRIVISVGRSVPLEWLAVFLAVASTLVVALLAWFVFHASRDWVSSTPLRLGLAGAICLMPAMGGENTANATNLIWTFAAVAPWTFLSRDETRRGTAIRSAVGFLAATSTPLCALYLPLAVWQAIKHRSRSNVIVAVSFMTGLAIQTLVVLSSAQLRRFPNNGTALAKLTGSRVYATFLFGDRGVNALWGTNGRAVVVGSTIVVGALLAILLAKAPPSARAVGATLALLSSATFLLPVALRGTRFLLLFGDEAPRSGGARYSVAPVVLLISSLAVLISPKSVTPVRNWRTIGSVLLVIQIAITSLIWFSITNADSYNADWRKEVARARAQCSGAAATTEVDLNVTLLSLGARKMRVICSDLRR